MANEKTEYSVIKTDKTGRYQNSYFTPSRGYHPMRQPDLIRVPINGGDCHGHGTA